MTQSSQTPLNFDATILNQKLLDQKLEALRQATETVGFSVAIVKGSEVIYSRGFGYRDLENKLAVDEDTLFPIGSVSKAFTVGLLGLMEEEKGLSFTDSPNKYLPELQFSRDELNNQVTILDMVGHRTGLPRHDFSWHLFPTDNRQELLARVQGHEPFTGIRTQWYYNNFMYLAMGLISEKLTGKTWEENIRERFFKPLEMKRSNLDIHELQTHKNISKGYALKPTTAEATEFVTQQTEYFDIAAISPAGSINSSALELSNWLKIWLNQGRFNQHQILPKSYIDKAMQPLMLIGDAMAKSGLPVDPLDSYGYAWFTSNYHGHYRLEHGGNIDGFAANACLLPNDDLGIVVLSNQEVSALPALARNLIIDELLDLPRTDWAKHHQNLLKVKREKAQQEKPTPIANTTPSHLLSEFIGTYFHQGYGEFVVSLEEDKLMVQFTRKKAQLMHHHYNVFMPHLIHHGEVEPTASLELMIQFQSDSQGKIAHAEVNLEPMLAPIRFVKVV